jgi:hypothetical protein
MSSLAYLLLLYLVGSTAELPCTVHYNPSQHYSLNRRILNYKVGYYIQTGLNIIRRWRSSHVNLVPCHQDMARIQVADGGDGLQIWRVAATTLDKQSRTAEWQCPSSLGAG